MEEVIVVGNPELSSGSGTRKRKSYWEMKEESSFPGSHIGKQKPYWEMKEESSFPGSDIGKQKPLRESSIVLWPPIRSGRFSDIKKQTSVWKSKEAEEVIEEFPFALPLIRSSSSSDIQKPTSLWDWEEEMEESHFLHSPLSPTWFPELQVKKENSSSSFLPFALPYNTRERIYQVEAKTASKVPKFQKAIPSDFKKQRPLPESFGLFPPIRSGRLSDIKKQTPVLKSKEAEGVMEKFPSSLPLKRSASSSDIQKPTSLWDWEEEMEESHFLDSPLSPTWFPELQVKKENSSSSFLPFALPSKIGQPIYRIEPHLPQQEKKLDYLPLQEKKLDHFPQQKKKLATLLDQPVNIDAATDLPKDKVLIEPIHQQNEDLASNKVCSGPSYEHQPPLAPNRWEGLESSEDAREVETPQLIHICGLFSLLLPYPSRIEAPKTSQVLKSMVSSGLTESITSLTILTAAVNANISNGNMVALALTNLISGIFLIRHDLAGLKKNTRKKGQPKGYIEILANGLHYLLHYIMALLSFVFFGLVPPLVYGFAFRETDDKDLKIAAAVGASLLCITLLAIAKTHVQKSKSWQVYVKNVGHYVLLGVEALALAYLAGNLVGKLIGKLGWFE